MHEDPKDMSGEMDDVFSRLFDWMPRDLTGKPQSFQVSHDHTAGGRFIMDTWSAV